MTVPQPDAPRREASGISKRFPGVLANDRIDFAVAPGEIHALLGENGAGKSTLVKIIYGVLHPDAGTLRWNGEAVEIACGFVRKQHVGIGDNSPRSEEHTSELQSLMRISYAVFCLKKQTTTNKYTTHSKTIRYHQT